MSLAVSRAVFLIVVILLLPVALLAGLVAGPVVAIAWICEDAKRTLRSL